MSFSALLFVLGFTAGCFLALGRHPIYGLLTYVGEFYIHPQSRWWGEGLLYDVRWSLIAAGVTLLAIAVRKPAPPNIPMLRHRVVPGMMAFALWLCAQYFWAIDPDKHLEFVELFIKYIIAIYVIYRCADSEQHLRLFLWAHVLGCFYFGWVAYTEYTGGRFEGFGGAGISEANAGALTIVTGIFVAGSLFLHGAVRQKVALLGIIPFLINGVVTTISRSGFLAMAVGGVIYNIFTPRRFAFRVRFFSVLALVLFVMLTNPIYWERIQSIKYKGEDVQGVDTGAGRLDIMSAQLRMFRDHPFGCGHFCTEILSPSYLPEDKLNAETGRRASHNTFLGLTVDQGAPGSLAYLFLLLWVASALRALWKTWKGSLGFMATLLPAVAAAFAAMTLGDMFVPYVRYEVRFWFVAVLMVMLNLSVGSTSATSVSEKPSMRLHS